MRNDHPQVPRFLRNRICKEDNQSWAWRNGGKENIDYGYARVQRSLVSFK